MRARILCPCAASFALVLSVAAISSHATERRDPLVYQDSTQSAVSARTSENAIKPVKHGKKPVHALKKPSSRHLAKTAAPAKKAGRAIGDGAGSQ